MGRKKKRYVEDHIFRIYPDYPLLVLDKIAWAKAGANDPLHFHYYLEIGYCYEGQGTRHFVREVSVLWRQIFCMLPEMRRACTTCGDICLWTWKIL